MPSVEPTEMPGFLPALNSSPPEGFGQYFIQLGRQSDPDGEVQEEYIRPFSEISSQRRTSE